MHTKDYETVYMVSGTAIWEIGGQTVEAVKGTTILIPLGAPHTIRLEECGKLLRNFGPR